MDPNSFQFPSRGELAVKSLFASTAEQRELARSLAVATPIKRDDQHSFFNVDGIDLTVSPIGREILEIVDAQLVEIIDPDVFEDAAEVAIAVDEIQPVAQLPDAVPVVPPDPPPAPTTPSAWENLNFQTPPRQTQNEP
jgi:hypothetical protein